MSENESKTKNNKPFFSYSLKLTTPSGKIKAFEAEDAYEFHEILKDGKKLNKHYILPNYMDKFCETFKEIQKKCENEKNFKIIKPYVNQLMEMRSLILNIKKEQYTPKSANLLQNIDKWLLILEKRVGINFFTSPKKINALTTDNINQKQKCKKNHETKKSHSVKKDDVKNYKIENLTSNQNYSSYLDEFYDNFTNIKETFKNERNEGNKISQITRAEKIKTKLNKILFGIPKEKNKDKEKKENYEIKMDIRLNDKWGSKATNLLNDINNWLNSSRSEMEKNIKERKYRSDKGKMFKDSHVSDLDSYYGPSLKPIEDDFTIYSLDLDRKNKDLKNIIKSEKQKLLSDDEKKIRDEVESQKKV